MEKEQIIKAMKKQLDYYAHDFLRYTDERTQKDTSFDYYKAARNFNGVLNRLYYKEQGHDTHTFTRVIELYISERNEDDWK